jgi:guanine deaminase
MFPDLKRDIPVLAAHGLLNSKTVLAHGCHLTTSEIEECVEKGVSVVSCPYSNILFARATVPVKKWSDMGLKIGLGTDVAGGWSSSLWENARLAVLQDRIDSFARVGETDIVDDQGKVANADWKVTWVHALYLATIGGAKTLGLDGEKGVGVFEVGKKFDALRVGLDVEGQRFEWWDDDSTRDRFERFVLGGDDRNILDVWVDGKSVL